MEHTTQLPRSVSLLNHNLTVSDRHIAYVSNMKPFPKIHLLDISQINQSEFSSFVFGKYKFEDEVLYIKYEKLDSYYLILGLPGQVHIWNEDCSNLLSYFTKEDIGGTGESLFIGSCVGPSLLVLGSSDGLIFLRPVTLNNAVAFEIENIGRWSIPITSISY